LCYTFLAVPRQPEPVLKREPLQRRYSLQGLGD